MDDEDRENEGDLILAGEKVTAEKINFMAKHARGLICLAMSQNKCAALNLNQMVDDNKSGHGTGFTVSIEAATGITTGISAAMTEQGPSQLPLKPELGQVILFLQDIFFLLELFRGSVISHGSHGGKYRFMQISWLNRICCYLRMMNEDGTMARKKALLDFSKKHNLKIGTIADLINYRILTNRLLKELSENQ